MKHRNILNNRFSWHRYYQVCSGLFDVSRVINAYYISVFHVDLPLGTLPSNLGLPYLRLHMMQRFFVPKMMRARLPTLPLSAMLSSLLGANVIRLALIIAFKQSEADESVRSYVDANE